MGLLGGGGGDSDGLLFKVAIFCTIITVVSTMLIGALLPGLQSDYSMDEIEYERKNVMTFTGDSITNSTPWKLTHVYTPFTYGSSYNIDDDGFIYGSEISDYSELGKTTDIKLNKNQTSASTLDTNKQTVSIEKKSFKWYYDPTTIGWLTIPYAAIYSSITNQDVEYITTETVNQDYQTFQHTGYRYVFDPMLPFNYDGGGDDVSTRDGSLSIVWYKFPGNSGIIGSGISGGLVIYGADQTIISNYSALDIIDGYNTNSGFASKYDFDFNGTRLFLNIRFDSDVINDSIPLDDAWNDGRWSLAITSSSAGNFIDIKNSTSFTDSLGGMVDTFIDIYTFDTPSIDNPFYDFILWMLVIFPAELALMFFMKSVFGMAGVGAGLVANILAMGLL